MSTISRLPELQMSPAVVVPSRLHVRSLCHPILHQVLREDRIVYLLMVCCRQDREWQLISQPKAVVVRWDDYDPTLDELGGLHVQMGMTGTRTTVTTVNQRKVDGKLMCATAQYELAYLSLNDMRDRVAVDEARNANANLVSSNVGISGELMSAKDTYKDPTITAIGHCSNIGAALAGAKSWDSEDVKKEVRDLLHPNPAVARVLVEGIRTRIKKGALESFKIYFEKSRHHPARRMVIAKN